MSTETMDRKFVPLSFLTEAASKDCVQVFADRWWIADDAGNALFNRSGNPMCNGSEKLITGIRDRFYPGLKIEHVPLAFIPISFGADFDYVLP